MLHPLTKLIIVICISTISIIYNNVYVLLILLLLSTLLLTGKRNLDFTRLSKFIKHFLPLLISIFIIQIIFNREGLTLLKISFLTVTDKGLNTALLVTLRLLVLFLSGVWLWGLSHWDLKQAFRLIGLPEALPVMISITLRFLPIFLEKVQQINLQLRLRAVNLRSIKLKQKLQLYLQLVTPILGWTMKDLKFQAIALDLRGFRNGQPHTVNNSLKLKVPDYLLILIAFACLLLPYFLWQK